MKKSNTENKSFSPRFTWRKLYKKIIDCGIFFPVVYSFFSLTAISFSDLNAAQHRSYMFLYWIGLFFALATMKELFKKNYKLLYLNDKKPSPANHKPKQIKKRVENTYPKLLYTGGNELQAEYDDRVDYYRFEEGKFTYCGSVKKDQHKQIR